MVFGWLTREFDRHGSLTARTARLATAFVVLAVAGLVTVRPHDVPIGLPGRVPYLPRYLAV